MKEGVMRSDMKKVVVERPRGQSYVPNRKFGARLPYIPDHDYDEQPKHVGISASYRDYSYSAKWLTDLLGPLERFLQSRMGQPWNDVYSEMCDGLDKRKTTGQHIFNHMERMVARHCFMDVNGRICHLRWGNTLAEVEGFYVHPQTGTLCHAPRPNKRALKRWRLLAEEVTWLKIDDTRGYRKHEGIWYHSYFNRVFVGRHQQPGTVWDIFLKKDVRLNCGWNLVLITKKQCNRNELRYIQGMLQQRKWRIQRM